MKSHISHARDGEVVQQECERDCQPCKVCAGIEEEGMPVLGRVSCRRIYYFLSDPKEERTQHREGTRGCVKRVGVPPPHNLMTRVS
jgi:hypothetical protein